MAHPILICSKRTADGKTLFKTVATDSIKNIRGYIIPSNIHQLTIVTTLRSTLMRVSRAFSSEKRLHGLSAQS
jgi:hypothetical protein